MANKTGKDMTIRIDDATGTLEDISCYVNNVALNSVLSMLEDSGLCDGESTFLTGLAGATVSANGFINTTTEAVYGPLVGNRTATTKTVEIRPYTGRYYNGEVYVNNATITGAPNTLQTFSADHTFTGAINRTTQAL